jgi:soluble lytic murein transglycosylase-like protein
VIKEKPAGIKSDGKYVKKKNTGSSEFHNIAEEKAKKHNVDPKLVKAVISAESNWNPKAVSHKGAVGMMQLMPKTANDLGVSNRYNPEENIEGGVKYLRHLLDKFNGNLTLELAAYNAGPARVEKDNRVPSIPETVNYVKRVMNDYSGGSGWLSGSSGSTKIRMVVLADGTVLFTNALATGHSYLTN